MKSSAVANGNNADATQYNNLREDAKGASTLLAIAQSTPGMTLAIQAGSVYFGTTKVDYAGGNTGTFTAPVGNPRIDLVYINSSGTITILQGTAAASPTPPATPANAIAICHVYLRISTTAIYDTDQTTHGYILRDIRPFLVAPQDVGVNRQVFVATGAGTWAKPGNGNIARVRVWGGGGSGGKGGTGDEGSSGGGGGSMVEKWFLLSDLAATESVSVGAGGASQTTLQNDGATGSNSTFGSGGTLVTAYGGGGGGRGGSAARGGGSGGGTEAAGAIGAASKAGADGGAPIQALAGGLGKGGATNVAGVMNTTGGGGGGGGGSSNTGIGGSSEYGGGGGGGGRANNTGAAANGGKSIFGGGGGGGGCMSGGTGANSVGGVSINGGNGGAGGWGATDGVAGSQPGGGGGGTQTGNSGAGGAGMVEVVVF